LRGSHQHGREVRSDDEEEDPDTEFGYPVDILRKVKCEDRREKNSEGNIDGLARAERHGAN
jgi:hypothetical protein